MSNFNQYPGQPTEPSQPNQQPGPQYPQQPAGPPPGYGAYPQYGGNYPGHPGPPGYQPMPGYPAPGYPGPVSHRSRLVAGLLGIFLGGLGIHNFYLGRTNLAVTQLLIAVLTCGIGAAVTTIWGLIEGILYLASKDPRWSTDAEGYWLT